MKRTLLIALFLCGILTIPLTATTYRVNNKVSDNAAAKIYSTLAKAQDVAQNGDTIMLEGSPDTYSSFMCAKRLIIKGPGYFLDENPGISANKLSANIQSLYLNQGSKGSVFIGVTFDYISHNSLGSDDITFRRCCIKKFEAANYDLNNIAFAECYFPTYYSYNIYIFQNATATNLVIMNCIFNSTILIGTGSNGQFLNNVFNFNVITIPTGFDMKNNILFTTDKTNVFLPALPDIDICNNISISDHFGTANNNKANVAEGSLFLGALTASTDGTWQLKAGSPAIGAGVGGIDCGAFGGLGPYILSGVPTGPVIYQLNVSSHSTSGNKLPVTIKVKSY
jgi:hypothetical protein